MTMAEQRVTTESSTEPDSGKEDDRTREITIGQLKLKAKPVPDDLIVALDLAVARAEQDGSNKAYRKMLHQVILSALKRTLSPEDADAAVDQLVDGNIDSAGLAAALLDIKEPANREERRQADRQVRRGQAHGRGRGRR